MTVYKLYYNNKELSDRNGNTIEDRYPLYAITNNKKYKKKFLKQRNSDRFIVVKKDMTNEEWISFANKRRGNVLARHFLEASNDKYFTKEVMMIVTDFEYQAIGESFDTSLTVMSLFNPLIFTDEYFKIFVKYEYPLVWSLYSAAEEHIEILASDEFLGEYPSAPAYTANELNILIDDNLNTFD